MDTLLKYRLLLNEVTDADNQFAISFSVDYQREDQIVMGGQGQFQFLASNGWTVVSSTTVGISVEEKVVAIQGCFKDSICGFPNQRVANQASEYFDDIQVARDTHAEITQALAEWAQNKGFSHIARGPEENHKSQIVIATTVTL